VSVALGIYRRELGRIVASSAVFFALPLGMAWVAWEGQYGAATGAPLDALDAAFRAVALVLAPLVVWAAAPALAAERAAGTSSLWAYSPVRPSAVVTGKLLAVLTFAAGSALLLAGPAVWAALASGLATWSRVGAGALGLLLLCLLAGTFTLLASALARHFSTAFAWGVGLLALWVWGNQALSRIAAAVAALLPPTWAPAVAGLFDPAAGWGGQAVLYPLYVGWVDLAAVAGMAAAAAIGLAVTHQVVASERWRG
jgi:ABC-type transport system involved in multi-copper enzyme maturation permease subunit